MKKLAFALVSKFKPYFQAYTVITLIDKPLQRAINSLKAAGQMALWAIKLSKFDIINLRPWYLQVITAYV